MPEIKFSASAEVQKQARMLMRKNDWSEAEAWQHILLLGLARLEQRRRLQEPITDWTTYADKLSLQAMDTQTGYSRAAHRRYELEHDLRIMEMRLSALQIELGGMQQALARCRAERRRVLELETNTDAPEVRQEGLAAKLRRAMRDIFGKSNRD